MVETVRLGTLNIWNRSGPWPARLELIRAEFSRSGIELLGLQEVLRFTGGDGSVDCQALDIAQGMGDGYACAFGRAADLGGGLELGNAVLSKYPILVSQNLSFPDTEGLTGRSVLYVRVDTPFGELPVFVTHLCWELHRSNARVAQVEALVNHVFDLAPVDAPGLPPVVMGDFNAEPDSDEIRFMRGRTSLSGRSVYFADAWTYGASDPACPGYTFDRRNAYSALAHEPPRRIDYIFVRGPDRHFRGEPLRTELAFCEEREGVWPSDHFGIVTDVAVSKRES